MRRRRKRGGTGLMLAGMLCLLLSAASAGALWMNYGEKAQPPSPEYPPVSAGRGVGRSAPGLTLQSKNAILFDPASGDVLYAKGAGERVYPASLTKVMTVLAALEGIESLDAPVTLAHEDYVGLYEQNASMAGLLPGETVTARDLLYASMLPSGAEAAQALARIGCGSVEAALEQMNAMAATLGMENTHFTNVTGLHDARHYTTVSDLAILWREALKNEALLAAASVLTYHATPTEQHPEGLLLVSTLMPRLKALELASPEPIVACKTGYTEEAGLCLVSVAERAGERRALVTVGAPGDGASPPNQLIDALDLYRRCLPLAG